MNSLKENLEPNLDLTPGQEKENGNIEKDAVVEVEKKEIELTPEQKKDLERLIFYLKHGIITDEFEKIEKSNISKEIMESAEVFLVAKEGLIYCLKNDFIDCTNGGRAVEIIEKFNSLKEIMESAEVLSVIKERLIYNLKNGNIDRVVETIEKLNPPKELIKSVVKELLIYHLNFGHVDRVVEIIKKLNISKEITESAEVLSVVKERLIYCLKEGCLDSSVNIIKKLNISKEITESAEALSVVKERLICCLKNGIINSTDGAVEIIEKFNPSKEIMESAEVLLAVKEGLIYNLKESDINGAAEIIEKFNPSKEIMESAAKEGLISCLKNNDIERYNKIQDLFNVNLSVSDIFESIPEIKELVSELEKISPEFAAQANKTADILISLLPFKNNHEGLINEITENPFLTDAISENPRFGSRLLIKYPEFDETSKENINFLFDAKKEIMAANPEMEPESLEFRQAMQEKLQGYANNQKIINKMEASGFNTEQWLNYDQTEYFTLESGGEQVAFSDVLSSPVERIKETIDSYAHCIKETLKQFRVEFSAKKISLGEDLEIKNKITILKEQIAKAEASGSEEDSKKAQGMKRGLEALEKKFGQEKTVVVWDKLIGEINSFQVLKDSLLAAQEKLVAAEKKLEEVTTGKTPSGKMIQDVKQQLNSAKEDLRTKFSLLERRIENFKTELPKIAGLVLGQERAEVIVQEIEMKVAEQFNHYETDRGTVANLFSEKSASEKDKMTGQPLSIFVWARNPDIDLYQGNYSPCCICIDSAHMGAESTIADYNSDLGVQIVNIWDEVKNEPITAAWCWPAIKAGKKVLMVDNIESKTKYSTNFPEQLTKELFSYLENYAQAIGADKVCLGKTYNDLPVASEAAKMSNDGNTYKKLGGYNRPDGYFLEAENNSVKIIWEKEVKEKKTKENKVEQVAKIEFANVNFSNLQKEKFALIKKLEKEIYPEELISGQVMIDDIEQNNGLEYSFVANGENPNNKKEEAVGYLIAVEDETDEGDKSVYLEDFAVKAEARGQGLGFSLLTNLIDKLKTKAEIENKPVLLDMHLREDSQHLISGKTQELEDLGARIIEEALVPDYYGDNIDALYLIFEIGRRGNEEDGYENDGDDEDDN